jgi:type IV secretion system protein VirD4
LKAILLSPLWALLYLLKTLLLMILAMSLVGLPAAGLMIALHLDHSRIANAFLIVLILVTLLVTMFWALTRPLLKYFGDRESGTHGTARFATEKETARLAQNKAGLLLGRDLNTGKLLRYTGPAHLLTMAPTRSGKGVGTIIPNLLTLDRSVICIDPKGENARIAGRARGLFGRVHILDPFGVTGRVSSSFNPLVSLDAASLDVAEEAATLADALVYDPPAQVTEAHWNEEAKALIAGFILYIAAQEPPGRRSLATLREHLTAAPDAFANLLVQMQGSTAAAGLIERAANRHLGKDHREAAGVPSAAQRHTHFLDSPRMTAALGHSDFVFGDLKSGTATVFLVLPPDRLGAYARWLRLMVTQSLQDMARVPAKPAARCFTSSMNLQHSAISRRSNGPWASWPVTACSSGPSCRTSISSAPPTAKVLAPSSAMPVSYRSSGSMIMTARAWSPICSVRKPSYLRPPAAIPMLPGAAIA